LKGDYVCLRMHNQLFTVDETLFWLSESFTEVDMASGSDVITIKPFICYDCLYNNGRMSA